MKNVKLILPLALAIALAGCSSQPEKQGGTPEEQKKGASTGTSADQQGQQAAGDPSAADRNLGGDAAAGEKKVEFSTGRAAFHRMFAKARLWAPDAKPVRLVSEPTADPQVKQGKAGVWRAQFASPSRRGLRGYTWSAADAGNDEQGISQGTEDTFNPNNTSTQPFDMQFLKVDTDKALETAMGKGGEKIMKQAPDTPIVYSLEWDARKNTLMWHVIFGASARDAKLHVTVDASTGGFLKTVK